MCLLLSQLSRWTSKIQITAGKFPYEAQAAGNTGALTSQLIRFNIEARDIISGRRHT